ncbi:substrate-binding domain-containing protein [Erwinia sp. B116]|uniref:substrate-binding domain-containing protein n=1 Tax=Erwinia sp. B116 TaxID=1561024 RepID=UPI000C755E31|nr:substrate-binding domain-containing protein [Erwinia sp. B116]PLV63746.1 rhizopine-binding protein [Erwinia sp. B116]
MKKFKWLLILISALSVFTAQAKTYMVGVALANLDLNFVSILRSQMEKQLNEKGVKSQYADAKGDVSLQIQQVDDFINQGADAIILNPVDTQGVLPIIRAAQKANIPLVFVNRKPETALTGKVAYVGSDSAVSGKMEIEALAQRMNHKGNVAILMGSLSTEEARQRTKAVEDFVSAHPGMKVVQKQTANWQRNEAVDKTLSWLQDGNQIDAIVANNDEMAIGAIMALDQLKKKDVLVAGIDGTPDALQFVKNGKLAVTIFQDAKGQAIGAVDVALAMLAGKKTEVYNWVPYQTITQANLQEFSDKNLK